MLPSVGARDLDLKLEDCNQWLGYRHSPIASQGRNIHPFPLSEHFWHLGSCAIDRKDNGLDDLRVDPPSEYKAQATLPFLELQRPAPVRIIARAIGDEDVRSATRAHYWQHGTKVLLNRLAQRERSIDDRITKIRQG